MVGVCARCCRRGLCLASRLASRSRQIRERAQTVSSTDQVLRRFNASSAGVAILTDCLPDPALAAGALQECLDLLKEDVAFVLNASQSSLRALGHGADGAEGGATAA